MSAFFAEAYLDQMLPAIFPDPQVRLRGEDDLSNSTTNPVYGQDFEIPIFVPRPKQIEGGYVAVQFRSLALLLR